MESLVFWFLGHQEDGAAICGHPCSATTVLIPGQRYRFKWDPTAAPLCVHCGEPATKYGKPWRTLDGKTFVRYNKLAAIDECVCEKHFGKLNPCTFNGIETYAPGCNPAKPRCSLMHAECQRALVYLASADHRLPASIKVGQTTVNRLSVFGQTREQQALARRAISGGYVRAIPIESEERSLWLGEAQQLERAIARYCNIPETFIKGGVTGKNALAYFQADDKPGRLEKAAENVLVQLDRRRAELPTGLQQVLDTLYVGEPVENPYVDLVDTDALVKLQPDKIATAGRRRGPQDITMELIGIRGNNLIGRDVATGEGAVIGARAWQGLVLGVEEA